jgi:hypothetical protein
VTSPTIDPARESRRQAYLEALYARSGRTCMTYTGLFQERQRELLAQDMVAVLAEPPTDEQLCQTFRTGYYAEPNRQGPVAQAAGLRAVLHRFGAQRSAA